MPHVDRDVCLKTADQCCQYYADVLANFADCRVSPVWPEMQRVAEEWRGLLKAGDPPESQLADLESQVLAKWDAPCWHTTWIWMATCIDIWLKSLGRKGLGPNPWYKDRVPDTVRPLW
jgi:hypothetical protein